MPFRDTTNDNHHQYAVVKTDDTKTLATPQNSFSSNGSTTSLGRHSASSVGEESNMSRISQWTTSTREYFRKLNSKMKACLLVTGTVIVWLVVILSLNSYMNQVEVGHMTETPQGMNVAIPHNAKKHEELKLNLETEMKHNQEKTFHVHEHLPKHHKNAGPVEHKFKTKVYKDRFTVIQQVCQGHWQGNKCNGIAGRKITKFIPLDKNSTATSTRKKIGFQISKTHFNMNIGGKQVAFQKFTAHPKYVTHMSFKGKWIMKKPVFAFRLKMSDVLQRLYAFYKKTHAKIAQNMHTKENQHFKQIGAPNGKAKIKVKNVKTADKAKKAD